MGLPMVNDFTLHAHKHVCACVQVQKFMSKWVQMGAGKISENVCAWNFLMGWKNMCWKNVHCTKIEIKMTQINYVSKNQRHSTENGCQHLNFGFMCKGKTLQGSTKFSFSVQLIQNKTFCWIGAKIQIFLHKLYCKGIPWNGTKGQIKPKAV